MNNSYPILLHHGICPFTRVLFPSISKDNSENDRFHYFRKIRSYLIKRGFSVFHTKVSWGASLDRRAYDLKCEIERMTDGFRKFSRVHIIGHSMGGLDARWMIYRYRMEDRVASLTTIGTPHHGSSLADEGLKRLDFLIPLFHSFGISIEGFRDLTTQASERRNRLIEGFEDQNSVLYQTVSGKVEYRDMFLLLRPTYRLIYEMEGENDGLVSLRSAIWKDILHIRTIKADHLGQIGWFSPLRLADPDKRRNFERYILGFYLWLAKKITKIDT